MGNLDLYEKVREVPEKAQKKIEGGRLKGMTDINPMWRIKTLTEQFGVCGVGWKANIVRTWLDGGVNNEVTANVEIELFIKVDGAWSEAIPGIGGSKFVSKESGGLYTDDECYKKAYTDALSVACKSLGIGADVYWDKDSTKYSLKQGETSAGKKAQSSTSTTSSKKSKWAQVNEIIKDSDITLDNAATTKINKEVLAAMIDAFDVYGNTEAKFYLQAENAKKMVANARSQVGHIINSSNSNEIIFTSGATEANNLVLRGSVEASSIKKGKIIISAIEHSSIYDRMRISWFKRKHNLINLDVDKIERIMQSHS